MYILFYLKFAVVVFSPSEQGTNEIWHLLLIYFRMD